MEEKDNLTALLKNEVAVLKNADAEILGIGDEGQGE
jgi:hypothetical protein